MQPNDDIMVAQGSHIPKAGNIVEAAINRSTATATLAITLFDRDGHCVARQRQENASRVDYAWSQMQFNWLKAHDWNAKGQCKPTNRICSFLTRSSMPFTHRAALPGGIMLLYEGSVEGVLAVSGGTDQQNA